MEFEIRPSNMNLMHILANIGNEVGVQKCVDSDLCLFYHDREQQTPLHHFIKHSTNPDCLNVMLTHLINQKNPYIFYSLSLLTPYIYKFNDPRIGAFLDKAVKPIYLTSSTQISQYRNYTGKMHFLSNKDAIWTA
jgi:hypothetical protein